MRRLGLHWSDAILCAVVIFAALAVYGPPAVESLAAFSLFGH